MPYHIGLDAENDVYLNIHITWDGPHPVSDADMVELAQTILASNAVQNGNWTNPPSITSIYADSSRTLYPTE